MAVSFGRALVLGATGGIGSAFVRRLEPLGGVAGLSRRDGLDWTDPGRAEASLDAAISAHGPFDLVIDATGALEPGGYAPERKLAAVDAAGMAAHFAINAIRRHLS